MWNPGEIDFRSVSEEWRVVMPNKIEKSEDMEI
jgi:hypothetical protein